MDIKYYVGVQDNKTTPKLTDLAILTAKSCGVAPKYSQTNSQALGVGGAFESDGWVSRAEVNGDIDIELTISQFKTFFDSAGFKSKVTNTKDLTYDLDPNGFTKYLTVVSDFYSDNYYEVAQSCLVSSLKINTTLQSYVTATMSVLGMEHEPKDGGLTGKIAPAVVEGRLKCLGVIIKENTTDITSKVESVDINIDRKLEGKGALNSIYTKAIVPSGKGEVSLNLQFNEFDKTSYKNAREMLKNNTSYKVTIEMADDLDPTRKITMEFPKVKISNVEATDLDGTGGIAKEMKAYTPAGSELPFIVKIVNYK